MNIKRRVVGSVDSFCQTPKVTPLFTYLGFNIYKREYYVGHVCSLELLQLIERTPVCR